MNSERLTHHSLSSPQKGIWFDQIRYPDMPLYNVGGFVRIEGSVNPCLLEKAVNSVIQENDALRTIFYEDTPLPVQTFPEKSHFSVEMPDFSEHDDPHQQAIQWMENELAAPFQLYGQHLFKFALIKASKDCYYGFCKYHHIIIDGWGISLVFQRIAQQYDALIAAADGSEEEARYSYVDFIEADQNYLKSNSYQQHEQYWQTKYRELPDPLIAPRMKVNGTPIPSHRQTLTLKWDFYRQLMAFAKDNKASTFHLMIAVLYCYFMRTGQTEEFVIGLPVLNRNSAAFKRTIGLFTGVTPARFRFGTALNFIELMQAISQTLRKDYRHQRFPLGEINKQTGVQKQGRKQLFDISLSYQKHDYLNTFAGNIAKLFTLPNGFEQSALAIAIEEYQDHQDVRLTFDYNLAMFDDADIERIIARFESLLGEVLARPELPIQGLNLMPEAERQKVLVEFNNTTASYPADKTIVDLFEQQVETTPHNVAVVFEDQQLTYQALNSRANQLAHHLHTLGVGPEVLVGICVERSLDMLIGLLGILKAGGAYVPLDPSYPKERLALVLEDANVSVLLSQEALMGNLPQHQAQIFCLDRDWATASNAPSHNPNRKVKPDNLAYIIYTSGSTGKPKGVSICQQSVVNFLTTMQHSPGLTEQDILLAVTTISFDIAVLELYLPLIVGAKIVLVGRDTASDGAELLKTLHNSGTTVMQATPATWRMLTTESESRFSGLKILVGGEALCSQLADQLLEKGAEIWNLYGPTETTVWSAIYPIKTKNILTGLTCDTQESIGRPIANTQIYILDANLQPVPIGISGELHIGGAGVARGYFNRPELTREKFISNPFSDEPGSRLYKTGDLARLLPDGNIEYLGRIDNQVKIRGFRIELGEIEAVLVQHPHVQETAVIIDQDASANKRLVAYFVADITPTSSELRDFLKQKLPDYMLPAYFIKLEALPLTPNGKINRRALQSLEINDESLSEETFVAPRTAEEEIVAGLWADILNIERVGIHDNFFELGGHSLLATQVMSRIRDTFSVELPVCTLFQLPMVSSLTEKIKASDSDRPRAPAIQTIERTGDIPLSFAQQRLWFLNQLEGGSSATYNMAAALRVSGLLHINAFEQSLTAMVQRHETLRTTFPTLNGMPTQKIQPLSAIKEQLSVVLLAHLATEKQTTEIQRLLTEEAQRPFDLAKGPLFRTTLLQLGPEEQVLLVTMHHIISDGWSIGVFIREIAKLYEAFSKGKASPLSPLPIQYADFAHWQRQWLTGEVLETQAHYWQQQLAGASSLLELPTDRPRPPVQSFKGHIQYFEINPSLSSQVKELAKKQGASLFMTLFSVYVILLHRYSGQEDIVVGSPIANRNRSEIESLIGFFVNTLVLRTQLSDTPHFIDLLNQVRQMSLEAYAHQDMPFETLVEIIQPERNLSHNPLFQVMFVLQNAPKEALDLSGLSISLLEGESVTTKSDLTLFMEETAQGLKGGLEYNTALFNVDTIERMAGHFQTLLADIIAHPERSLSELQLLTTAEQHQLLIDWNNTTAPYPDNQCVHQLFEAQVEKTPDAIAVVFENQELSYQALNRRANQLAHHLQTLGVGPEVLVGICVERSLEMIVGLLATLKAGGAYVPLDPNYPEERLAFMLADSQVLVLLTQNQLMAKLPAHQAKVICLDTEQTLFSQGTTSNLISGVRPNNLAYVIYTSGSTGKPKGVLVEHRGVTNLAQAQIQSFDVKPESRVLQFASISFDASIWEIVMALGSGATLCLGTTESLLPGPALVQHLRKWAISHVTFPPTAVAVLSTEELSDLECIIVAGEASSPELAALWSQGRRFFNAYGPTEDTVCATIFEYTAGHSTLPIGRPLPNQQIYILDQRHHPVPIGVPGELYIGGVGLARGYLNRPDLTQDKFIANPFVEFGTQSDHPSATKPLFKSERLYKTGDLARYRSDGNIEFLGRLDHQVKLRGFRIELGEIESLLTQHPNVQENFVIAREDKAGNQSLVAYFVSDLVPQKFPYHNECLVERDGESLTFNIEEISRHGICLQQDEAASLQQGDEIRLQLQLSDELEPHWLPGKVSRSRASWVNIDFNLTTNEQACLARHFESLLAENGLLQMVQNLLVGNLRHYLEEKLPKYMVPAHFVLLTALPMTPNGKIDRHALPAPEYQGSSVKKDFLPQTEIENQIAAVWEEVLQIKTVGIYDHFFEIGGHSLLIAQVQSKLQDSLGQEISLVELFENPTIQTLAQHLSEKKPKLLSTQPEPQTKNGGHTRTICNDIAIIGMAGRFPGANDIEAFWQNLQNGVESITFFSDEEVRTAGINNATLKQPNYIKAGGILSDIEQFDAAFFDFSPKEAEQMDPQHRLFLECAWQAIEHAGIEPGTDDSAIGVYAGVGMNTYLLNNLYPNHKASSSLNHYQLMIGNSNDFLPTRVSYKLNLKGPSINIQTACSTSLVAVHTACQSLLDGECDVALAGGVSIRTPQKTGYLYQEGMIMSPDGHCRAFDAKAQGTVVGNGVGVVVLKKLEQALADGDCIHAIIKGSDMIFDL